MIEPKDTIKDGESLPDGLHSFMNDSGKKLCYISHSGFIFGPVPEKERFNTLEWMCINFICKEIVDIKGSELTPYHKGEELSASFDIIRFLKENKFLPENA